MKRLSKILSVLLALCMLVVFLPAVSFAEDGTAYAVYNDTDKTLTFCVGTREGDMITRSGDGEPLTVSGDTFYTGFTSAVYTQADRIPWKDHKGEITTVRFLDEIRPKATAHWFQGFSLLTDIQNIEQLKTGDVTDMSWMFDSCSRLTSLDLSSFDTSKTVDSGMRQMFSSCSGLKSLNLTDFNTSKITTFWGMFTYCSSLESLDLSSFDTSSASNFYSMFYGCTKLDSVNLSSFDVSKVKSMWGMFYNCKALKSLDLSSFVPTSATDFSRMFEGCENLQTITFDDFDTRSATTMQTMFYGCKKLTSLDVSSFKTGNVTNMSSMFRDCAKLTSLDLSNFDTGKVTTMGNMFRGCSLLASVNVGSFDTGKVTTMDWMFGNCPKLTSLDISNFNTEKVTGTYGMFNLCAALDSLTLGEQFRFVSGTSSSLPAISYSSPYVGYWVTDDHPGLRFSSAKLMTDYDGASMAGTWVRRRFTSLSGAVVSPVADQTYTGGEITPAVSVTLGGAALIKGTDYTVTFEDNVNVGNATFTITGIGEYDGTLSGSFGILAKDIDGATVYAPEQTYTGNALTPAVRVTLPDGTVLDPAKDYTVSYDKNVNVGNADIYITGKGNYTGSVNGSFAIVARGLDGATIDPVANQTYTGEAITPAVRVTLPDGKVLNPETDYTVSYDKNVNVGNADVTVTGKGNYEGFINSTFAITARSLDGATISPIADLTYTGAALEPAVTVTLPDNTVLIPGTDYTVSYNNNENAGTASVTVTGTGNYAGTVNGNFTITEKSIANADVEGAEQTYSGDALTTTLTVILDNVPLEEGVDFEITNYEDNVDAGTATVTVAGIGNYAGAVSGQFTIRAKNLTTAEIHTVNQTYSGEEIIAPVTVTVDDVTLTEGVDFIVEYTGNVEEGTATVTITGIGNYEGSAFGSFEIKKPVDNSFHCKRCDWYDKVKDTPGITGIVYWLIHTITHFVQMINYMT